MGFDWVPHEQIDGISHAPLTQAILLHKLDNQTLCYIYPHGKVLSTTSELMVHSLGFSHASKGVELKLSDELINEFKF